MPVFIFEFSADISKPINTLMTITVEVLADDVDTAVEVLKREVTIRDMKRFKPKGAFEKTYVNFYQEG